MIPLILAVLMIGLTPDVTPPTVAILTPQVERVGCHDLNADKRLDMLIQTRDDRAVLAIHVTVKETGYSDWAGTIHDGVAPYASEWGTIRARNVYVPLRRGRNTITVTVYDGQPQLAPCNSASAVKTVWLGPIMCRIDALTMTLRPPNPVRIAGRVLSSAPLIVSDGSGQVVCISSTPHKPGDMVTVTGWYEDGRLTETED